MSEAIASMDGDTESVWKKNIARMNEMGIETVSKILATISAIPRS